MADAKLEAAGAPGGLSPLRHRAFALLWLATVTSNIGTWMNDVGAGWLMTSLASDPTTVALIQTATTLPVFLFALPAGALADIVDRRRLLLTVNLLMALAGAALTALVATGTMTVELLLLFTFLLGSGAAFVAPAWQAIVPALVPRTELPAAVSLNSVGINLSRAVGPAVAGVLIASVGLHAPFLLNAISFAGIIAALWWWPGEARTPRSTPPETLIPAMIAGLRYARWSPGLRRTMARAVAFFLFASSYWALLPLIARDVLGGGAGLYGILLGCIGAGALAGAVLLPSLRARIEVNRIVLLGALCTAAAMAAMSLLRSDVAAAAAAALAGASWIAVLTSFHVSAQTALPNWVRARGLSLFLTTFFGAMSAGSLLWGALAAQIGIAATLLTAAAAMSAVAVLSMRIRLTPGDGSDHAASLHWPAPPAVAEDERDFGPVMVTIDYRVADGRHAEFLDLMETLRQRRLRDGGYGWQLFRIAEEAEVTREVFLVPSWQEHLRQHERVTESERELQGEIAALMQPGVAPLGRGLIMPDPQSG